MPKNKIQTITETVNSLSTEAKLALIANTLGEIAKAKAIADFKNTLAVDQPVEVVAVAKPAAKPKKATKKPKAKQTKRSKVNTRPAAGNRVSDHIVSVLAKGDASITTIAGELQNDKTFSSSSKNIKNLIRTSLHGMVQKGVIQSIGRGVYGVVHQPETAPAE